MLTDSVDGVRSGLLWDRRPSGPHHGRRGPCPRLQRPSGGAAGPERATASAEAFGLAIRRWMGGLDCHGAMTSPISRVSEAQKTKTGRCATPPAKLARRVSVSLAGFCPYLPFPSALSGFQSVRRPPRVRSSSGPGRIARAFALAQVPRLRWVFTGHRAYPGLTLSAGSGWPFGYPSHDFRRQLPGLPVFCDLPFRVRQTSSGRERPAFLSAYPPLRLRSGPSAPPASAAFASFEALVRQRS